MKIVNSRIASGAVLVSSLLGAALVAGCQSTTPIPADKYARTQASIKTSEEMGANEDPQAALHLKLAKEQLSEAKELMRNGDNLNAKTVLERAEADGEASYNIARARSAKVEAQKTVQNVQQQMMALQPTQKGSGT